MVPLLIAVAGAGLVVASAALELLPGAAPGLGSVQRAGVATGLALLVAAHGLSTRPAGGAGVADVPWLLLAISLLVVAGVTAGSRPAAPAPAPDYGVPDRLLELERVVRPPRRAPGVCRPPFEHLLDDVSVEPVAAGFTAPVYVTSAGDGSGRLFVVERAGTVRIVEDGLLLEEPFLDLSDQVASILGERGMFSIAFEPEYARTGRFYVHYTSRPDGVATLSRFVTSADPRRAVRASEEILLTIPTMDLLHYGGQLQFGPDGYLYLSVGDGGGIRMPTGDSTVFGDGAVFYVEGELAIPPGTGYTRLDLDVADPWNQAQDLSNLRGKILRIDVSTDSSYAVPPDNPFADDDETTLGEIWAYGFRNPWRFSFDACDGSLFVGDVGHKRYEEIDLVERGGNYGWDRMEAAHCFPSWEDCDTRALKFPIAEYGHPDIDPLGGSAVIGGYVYRGRRIPSLVGRYVFADFVSSRLWTLTPTTQAPSGWHREEVMKLGFPPSSFGVDDEGELLIVGYDGTLRRLVPNRGPRT